MLGRDQNPKRPRRGKPPGRAEARRRTVRCLKALGILIGVWLLSAYLILPALWRHYEHHPAHRPAPKTTLTRKGSPAIRSTWA